MGRKRTSNKRRILLSVDKDLVESIDQYEVNRSKLFSDAAEKFLEKNSKKVEKEASH